MKKSCQLVGLDCASCAQKMEDAIRRLEGVQEVSVSFLTQRLTLTIDDNAQDQIMKKVIKACRRVESDCEILF